MKTRWIPFLLMICATRSSIGGTLPGTSITYPYFPGPPGSGTTTAIHKDSVLFTGWADSYTAVSYGTGVDNGWKTPQKALGKATSDTYDIVCLGNGGHITLTFSKAIQNGSGFDFAVFENGNDDTFLELAWVEVSSDGQHFVRFPNFYTGVQPVGPYAGHDTKFIYGLAGKYRQAYGTPFDLQQLTETYALLTNGTPSIYDDSPSFKTAFIQNYPYLDLNAIRYVRVLDIVGNGSAKDASDYPIYDPTPTYGSGGFDLEAIGVIHQAVDPRTPQVLTFPAVPHQKVSTGSIGLNATASSGLPVDYHILEGNALVLSNRLTFTGSGQIVLQAQQPGNEAFAPAVPVTQSFYVAEKIQHIYVEPIPNQIAGTNTWRVRATSSSGLPVQLEILSGPSNTVLDSTNGLLTIGNQTGQVELRAWQNGDAATAPADELRVSFSIVSAGAATAPKTFAQWSTNRNLATQPHLDSDGDGAPNFQEFMMGSNPTNSTDAPRFTLNPKLDIYGDQAMQLTFQINRQALGRTIVQQTDSLSGNWITVVPKWLASQSITNAGQVSQELQIELPVQTSRTFYRLQFQEP